MPKLKVDHVVSFSSEDTLHVASNVLLNDSTKKWKCGAAGEKSASIVLQLEKISTISGVDIGNEHSAYVEILVSRSSASADFRVLLVMSSFMTPLESRQSTNVNKVRMFGYNDFQSPERDEKWDRIKIVCTQPFNRHVQYGLSFVTLNSLESKDAPTATVVKLGNFSLRPSSPDSFSAGSLFAKRKKLANDTPQSTAAAAIRVASTSGVLNGSPQPTFKLKQNKPSTSQKVANVSLDIDTPKRRNRSELLYNEDEELPNKKIDKLIELKNKETQDKLASGESEKEKKKKEKIAAKDSSSKVDKQTPKHTKRRLEDVDEPNKKVKLKNTRPFKELLKGVVIVISGIQNPERANIRAAALEMGAKYKGDWDDTSTHLICAFTNTPKFKQVQGKGKIVNRLWIQDCHDQRKRLPWRRYALDSSDQNKNESEDEICEAKSDSPEVNFLHVGEELHSEDEQWNLLPTDNVSNIECYNVDTDEEDVEVTQATKDSFSLPDFFSSNVFYVDENMSDTLKKDVKRYIIAYKGLLLDEPSDIVNFVITLLAHSETLKELCSSAKFVSCDWIWECHNAKALVSYDRYKL